MFDLSLDGASELIAGLDALPDALRAALTEKIQSQAQALYSQVVDVNLDGGVLNVRSGALRDSIEMDVQPQDALIGATIYASGAAPYAAILEFGGKTSAHEILPDKAKACPS
jgi:phage gpG-like protein